MALRAWGMKTPALKKIPPISQDIRSAAQLGMEKKAEEFRAAGGEIYVNPS